MNDERPDWVPTVPGPDAQPPKRVRCRCSNGKVHEFEVPHEVWTKHMRGDPRALDPVPEAHKNLIRSAGVGKCPLCRESS